jgi:hypothetical protein
MLVTLTLPSMCLRSCIKPAKARKFFDPQPWKERPFIVFAVSCLFGLVGLYIPYFYVDSFARSKGLADTQLPLYLLPIMNAGSFMGRLVSLSYLNLTSNAPRSSCDIDFVLYCRPHWSSSDSDSLCFDERDRSICMGCSRFSGWVGSILCFLRLLLGNLSLTDHDDRCCGSLPGHERTWHAYRYGMYSMLNRAIDRFPDWRCSCERRVGKSAGSVFAFFMAWTSHQVC